MEKVLGLAQVAEGRKLDLQECSLSSYLQSVVTSSGIAFNDKTQGEGSALFDPVALDVVLKDLMENSKLHGQGKASVCLEEKKGELCLTYSDGGIFKADPHKAGRIFHKSQDSPRNWTRTLPGPKTDGGHER